MPSEPQAAPDEEPERKRPGESIAPSGSEESLSRDGSNAPQPSREELSAEMDAKASSLTADYERLGDIWPTPDNARIIFIANLEDVRDYIIDLRKKVKRCKDATAADASDNLSEGIEDLEGELRSAKTITEAAFRSLEVHDREGQFLKQSELHAMSIEQLPKLSRRCTGLARLLRGQHHVPQ
jgi:hypothetical protein